jgi:hypothetical protein
MSSEKPTDAFRREELARRLEARNQWLSDIGKRIDEFVEENQAALQRSVDAIFADASRSLTEQAEWHRRLSDWADQFTKAVETISAKLDQPLRLAGAWLPPTAELDLYALLEDHVGDESHSPAPIRALIVAFYHANGFEKLTDLVDSWDKSPYLQARWQLVMDALEAHKQGKYTLSVPSLLPLIEGMLISQLGKPASGGVRNLATTAIRNKYSAGSTDLIVEVMLEYIVSERLYGKVPPLHFSPEEYPKWLEAQGLEPGQVLNRHAILHGIHGQYATVDNSLRVFFVIDYLAFIDTMRALKD